MLTVADSAWHVLAIASIIILGMFFTILLARFFKVSATISLFLYGWHSVLCCYYLFYTFDNVADAKTYYLHSLEYQGGLTLGSNSVYFITSLFSTKLNISYAGVFFIYNIIGFSGLMAFFGAINVTTKQKTMLVKKLSILILFMPGISFWTSAIGKDSIAFMAIGLTCWGVLNIEKRYIALIFSTTLLLFVRPHIAGLQLCALAATIFFVWKGRVTLKLILVCISIPSSYWLVNIAINYIGLNAIGISVAEINNYIADRQFTNLGGGSSIDISSMPLLFKMFSYMFRPFAFEQSNMLGLILGFENVLLFGLCLIALIRSQYTTSSLPRYSRAFYVIFGFLALFILSSTTANLGIALRQKWMVFPVFLILGFSYLWEQKKTNGYILDDKK